MIEIQDVLLSFLNNDVGIIHFQYLVKFFLVNFFGDVFKCIHTKQDCGSIKEAGRQTFRIIPAAVRAWFWCCECFPAQKQATPALLLLLGDCFFTQR